MNFKFKAITKCLLFVKLEKKGNCWEKWLLGADTSLVFTFSHRPKLKQPFQNDWCTQVFILHNWTENSTIYVHRNKNAKFYSRLLICMATKKYLNADCILFQSVQNLERRVYVIALPFPHLVCYSLEPNPYSWLQSVLSDTFARSTHSIALYLLLAGENWVSFKTFITTAIWQEVLLKFLSVGIQTLGLYR